MLAKADITKRHAITPKVLDRSDITKGHATTLKVLDRSDVAKGHDGTVTLIDSRRQDDTQPPVQVSSTHCLYITNSHMWRTLQRK